MTLREHAYRITGQHLGCSDGNCVWGDPGVHTNGGCSCYDSRNEIWTRRQLLYMSQVAKQLAREVTMGCKIETEAK